MENLYTHTHICDDRGTIRKTTTDFTIDYMYSKYRVNNVISSHRCSIHTEINNFQISFSDESQDKIKKQAKINYNNFLKKSEIKRYDEKGYNSIVLSVIDDNNKTFEYYVQKEALIFLTLKLKEQGKTYDNLKPLK